MKKRILNSIHDFVLAFGVISFLMYSLYLGGYIEGLLKWHSSDEVAGLNMQYAGNIKGHK